MTKLISPTLLLLSLSALLFAQQTPTSRNKNSKQYSNSIQAVVVTMPGWDDVHGTGQLFKRSTIFSKWRKVGEAFPVVVGRTGLAWGVGLHEVPTDLGGGAIKKEGDGKSPAGVFALSGAFGRGPKPRGTKLSFLRINTSTECVDDVTSRHYNSSLDRKSIASADWSSSEKMFDITPEYDLGVFVDHNPTRTPSVGSCIFLHIWTDPGTPTAGCTSMSRKDVERILNFLDPRKRPVLIQMTEKEFGRFKMKFFPTS
ncbi:MAG: L,D-transpeptidase [Acidobacteriota bacterium]